MTSSQPADTSSPVLYEVGLIIQRPGRLRKGEKKILYRPVELEFFEENGGIFWDFWLTFLPGNAILNSGLVVSHDRFFHTKGARFSHRALFYVRIRRRSAGLQLTASRAAMLRGGLSLIHI